MPSSSAAFTCTPSVRRRAWAMYSRSRSFTCPSRSKPDSGRDPAAAGPLGHALHDVFGKALGQNRMTLLERHGSLDDILQLADVAGPLVGLEQLHRLLGQSVDRFSHLLGILAEEMLRQEGDVLRALTERRQSGSV